MEGLNLGRGAAMESGGLIRERVRAKAPEPLEAWNWGEAMMLEGLVLPSMKPQKNRRRKRVSLLEALINSRCLHEAVIRQVT